jgi:hypothetical protein
MRGWMKADSPLKWKVEAVDREDGTFKIVNASSDARLYAKQNSDTTQPSVLAVGDASATWAIESRGPAFMYDILTSSVDTNRMLKAPFSLSQPDQKSVADLPEKGNTVRTSGYTDISILLTSRPP